MTDATVFIVSMRVDSPSLGTVNLYTFYRAPYTSQEPTILVKSGRSKKTKPVHPPKPFKCDHLGCCGESGIVRRRAWVSLERSGTVERFGELFEGDRCRPASFLSSSVKTHIPSTAATPAPWSSDPSPTPSAKRALAPLPGALPSHRSQFCCRRLDRGWRGRGCRPGRGRSRCRAAGRNWRRDGRAHPD